MGRRAPVGDPPQPASAAGAGPLRLVFAGTPTTALPALEALLASRHELAAVLTRPDAPAGRGRRLTAAPVAARARELGLPVLTPDRPRNPDFLARLGELSPDCCPVVAYGALLPAAALALPAHGWVNLHFSLLPAWRGAAPVQRAILNGDEVTGASTFRLEADLDTGPVYGVVTEVIGPTDTAGDLLMRLARSGARLLVATLDGIESGELIAVAQPADGISYAPKLAPAEARVDWAAPCLHVDRLVRAATPTPGAWTTWRGHRLVLGPVRPAETPTGEATLTPGEPRPYREGVLVGTATGPVRLGTVRPEGRASMPADAWVRGARPAAGERLR